MYNYSPMGKLSLQAFSQWELLIRQKFSNIKQMTYFMDYNLSVRTLMIFLS